MTFPPTIDLVPHSPPTLALDEMVAWQDGEATLALRIRDDTLLVRDGRLDTVVALELMAQAVAACLGYEAFRGGEGVRVGMVVACRRMTIVRPSLAVGERILLVARRVRGSDAVSTFATETRDEAGELVATATMTIVHGERPPA